VPTENHEEKGVSDDHRTKNHQEQSWPARTGQTTRKRIKNMQNSRNGICERFHKTVLNEFYRITFRKKIYNTLDELQIDLDT